MRWLGPVLAGVGALVPTPAAADDAGVIRIHAAYGKPTAFVLQGRVLEENGVKAPDPERGKLGNLIDTVERLESDELVGVRVEVGVGARRYVATTDDDGVWRVVAERLDPPLAVGPVPVEVRLLDDADHPTPPAHGHLLVLPAGPWTALISDFDDTVADSGVTHKGRLVLRTLTRNAAQMEPVPGVADAFAAAMEAGAVGIFYVSGSPQNLYERIAAFLELQGLPPGPILLKNFGRDPPLEQDAYKGRRIDELLAFYPDMRFVLVGDSGERDPEIYAAVRRRAPGRVRAVVIRVIPGADNAAARLAGTTAVDDYTAHRQVLAEAVGKEIE